jgi:hypothetical protein
VLKALQSDTRMRLLPVRFLFHDRFDPASTLAHLRTPKLLLYSARGSGGLYFDQAAEPKEKARLRTAADYVNSLRSFLSKYLTRS